MSIYIQTIVHFFECMLTSIGESWPAPTQLNRSENISCRHTRDNLTKQILRKSRNNPQNFKGRLNNIYELVTASALLRRWEFSDKRFALAKFGFFFFLGRYIKGQKWQDKEAWDSQDRYYHTDMHATSQTGSMVDMFFVLAL